VKPGSPHVYGKVEGSQKTDREEFYSTMDLGDETWGICLAEWPHHYNWEHPHGAHHGKMPMDKYFDLRAKTPFWHEVLENLIVPKSESKFQIIK